MSLFNEGAFIMDFVTLFLYPFVLAIPFPLLIQIYFVGEYDPILLTGARILSYIGGVFITGMFLFGYTHSLAPFLAAMLPMCSGAMVFSFLCSMIKAKKSYKDF